MGELRIRRGTRAYEGNAARVATILGHDSSQLSVTLERNGHIFDNLHAVALEFGLHWFPDLLI